MSWKRFLLELKFHGAILLAFKCVRIMRDSLFLLFWKWKLFVWFRLIRKVGNHIFAKQQSKQSLNSLFIKRIEVLSVLSRRLLCFTSTIVWCVQKDFVKNWKVSVTVIKRGLENLVNINFYACDLYYLTRTIFNMPDFLCACVGAYEYDCAYHLGRPECQN